MLSASRSEPIVSGKVSLTHRYCTTSLKPSQIREIDVWSPSSGRGGCGVQAPVVAGRSVVTLVAASAVWEPSAEKARPGWIPPPAIFRTTGTFAT